MSYIELTTLLNVKRLPFFCYSLEVSLFSSVSFPMHTAFTHIHLIYFVASLSSSLPLSISSIVDPLFLIQQNAKFSGIS